MTAYLIAARRSPVMPRGGAFARLDLPDLATPVIAATLADAGMDPAQVDEIIVSNALGAGGNPARRIALAAGLPEHVAGLSLDRQCVGGLDALGLAAAMIASGQANVVLAGGVESYSRRPLRFATVPDHAPIEYDAPPFTPWPDRDPDMADAAAALAQLLHLTRPQQDAYACASHAKAMAAGFPEITPLLGIARDGFTRPLTPKTAARARAISGTISAATMAVAADAAAFCLVVSPRIAAQHARALRIAACVTRGADPTQPGLAPLPAVSKALHHTGLQARDIAQSEIMEAFAAQAIACIQGADLDPARCNLKGGALARGHPIGASGAILAARLFHDLQSGHGLAAIAAAGGIGTALILSN